MTASTEIAADTHCSAIALDAAEPLAATAPLARTWVVLEQPGPYGAKALHDSHIAPQVGAAFAAATDKSAVTVLLARPVGPHADAHHPRPHRFWIAHTAPSGVRMRHGVVDDLGDLVNADLPDVLERAGRGELPAWGAASREPLLLVCTNGRRDVCCALAGRPLAAAVGADPAYAAHVLETSHLGGHRFAPTALVLPSGMAYGRLTPDVARSVLDTARAGGVHVVNARGRTALARPSQAADLAVRAAYDIHDDSLDVLVGESTLAPPPLRWDGDGSDDAAVVVRHRDGRAWHVTLRREHSPKPRAESCGKAPGIGHWWVAGTPTPAPAWRTPGSVHA